MYTVFPNGYEEEFEASYMPQDFTTYKEAKEYAEQLSCDYTIEYTKGDIV